VIALALKARPIRLGNYGGYFRRFEITDGRLGSLFEGNQQDFRALQRGERFLCGHKAEKAPQRRQATVACSDRCSAPLLNVLKECQYFGSIQMGQS
jgi:hypothetical protein